MNILDLFRNNNALNIATDVDIELYNQLNKLKDRFEINSTTLTSDAINYSISKDWERFKHSISGVILMREHYSNDNVKCVHNKWENGAKIPLHIHNDSDQRIWVHNGSLCIEIFDATGEILIETRILTDKNIDQPFIIPKSIPHTITALQDADFVSRFDIYN